MHAHVLYFAESNKHENQCKLDAIYSKLQMLGHYIF